MLGRLVPVLDPRRDLRSHEVHRHVCNVSHFPTAYCVKTRICSDRGQSGKWQVELSYIKMSWSIRTSHFFFPSFLWTQKIMCAFQSGIKIEHGWKVSLEVLPVVLSKNANFRQKKCENFAKTIFAKPKTTFALAWLRLFPNELLPLWTWERAFNRT